MKKPVVNEAKMEEGEFLPSKEIPDLLEDGQVMSVYWTLQHGEVYSFVMLEDRKGDSQYYSGNNAEDEGDKFHIFSLYGALHGKVYPWQVELADLSPKLQRVCKARSGAQAELLLFEKAQSIMDAIAASKKEEATAAEKIAAWKQVTHIENLYSTAKLKKKIFNSRRRDVLGTISDNIMSETDLQYLKTLLWGFDEIHKNKGKKSIKKTHSVRAGQTSLMA